MQMYAMVEQALGGTVSLVPAKNVVAHGLITPSSLQSLHSVHMDDIMEFDDSIDVDTPPQEALDWFLL
jgi:hypothetical protein